MFTPRFPLELLSPAKNEAVARAAIDAGADALYIGGPAFSARAAAANDWSTVERVASYSHRFGAKTYLAINTVLFDSELEEARKAAWSAYEAGVDALIVQDMAFLEMDLPPLPLHASTQCDVRGPEKVRFLDDAGFSQIVLARELTLEEIAACRAASPRARLEFFIHGALCVSYSGQCYISAATRGRSANRGACAQLCRLPYTLTDALGTVLKENAYLLSLRDNDQTDNLEGLIRAGVTSFKIEGRLKEVPHVKNITAYYRKKLDAILEKYGWEKASFGHSEFTFEPNTEKTFHRGKTDVFVNGRPETEAELRTPKSIGEFAGTVLRIDYVRRAIEVKAAPRIVFGNGDGLAYFNAAGEFKGLRINRAEKKGDTFLLYPFEAEATYLELKAGFKLYRNNDYAFHKVLENENSAKRRIPIKALLAVSENALTLKVTGATKEATASVAAELPAAKTPEKTREAVKKSLEKTGDTPFTLCSFDISGKADRYIAPSLLNGLRREALQNLEDKVSEREALPRLEEKDGASAKGFASDYRANVCNRLAKAFWAKHGLTITEAGFEVNPTAVGRELMRSRYCIRNEIGLCPRALKGRPEAKEAFKRENFGHLKPEPFTLTDAKGFVYTVRFDCRACEMTLELEKKPAV